MPRFVFNGFSAMRAAWVARPQGGSRSDKTPRHVASRTMRPDFSRAVGRCRSSSEHRPRTRRAWFMLLVGFALLVAPRSASAEFPHMRLKSLFPCGGQVGTTVEVRITGGEQLDEVDRLLFDHDGIRAEPKTEEVRGKQKPVEGTFLVTIGKDVPPGLYEVRIGGLFGVSNPRTFVVGRRKELLENEPNDSREQAMEIPLDSVVSGGMKGNADIDWFRFRGKQGDRILAEARAYRIDSRMDATVSVFDTEGNRLGYGRNSIRRDPLVEVTLPADGDYFVKLHDFTYQGGDDFFYRLKVHAGPYVDFVVPASAIPGTTGEFTLYGRNLPDGEASEVEVRSAKLQKLTVRIPIPEDREKLLSAENLEPYEAGMNAVTYTVESPRGESNPVMIYLAEAPVTIEREPNDDPQQAQEITIPTEFAGQFQNPEDIDHLTFTARKGEFYSIEVYGQRLGTSIDPYFVLDRISKNKQGEEQVRRITAQDDTSANLDRNDPYPVSTTFQTDTDDPGFRFEVPADGTYRLKVRDRYYESRGSPELTYRLVVRRLRPDFRLIVAPAYFAPRNRPTQPKSLVLRRGENITALVLAMRRDGYDGPIEITADDLPSGVTCVPAVVPEGSTGTELVFSAAADAPPSFGRIRVRGKARIGDPEKNRAVTTANEALKNARKPLSNLRQAARKSGEELKQAQQKLSQAENAAKMNEKNENLAKQVETAKKNVARQKAETKKARAALAAAKTKFDAAKAVVANAESEREAAIHDVVREASAGTVAWKAPNNNASSTLRLARSIVLSVADEQAPFQLATDLRRVEVHQGRQVVLPLEIRKSGGFDDELSYGFSGIPRNSNLQFSNGKIAKGRDAEIVRLFVARNTPPGTYCIHLNAQGKFEYSRNPAAIDQAETEQKEIAEYYAEKRKAVNVANRKRDAAVQNTTKAAQALQQAQAAQKQQAQNVAQAQAALQAATAEKQRSATQFAAAEKASTEAREKLAAAKEEAEAIPDEKQEEAKKSLAAAEEIARQKKDALAKAEQATLSAEKKLAEAKTAAEKAEDDLAAADKNIADAQVAMKTTAEIRKQTESAVKSAAEEVKAAQDLKQQADREVAKAKKDAQPRSIDFATHSTPFVIVVHKAPATISADVPNGGNLAPGGKLDVKVSVKRAPGFAGPVTLSLPQIPGVTGLRADPVTIPVDKDEGILTIHAESDMVTAADKPPFEKQVQEAEETHQKLATERETASKAREAARIALAKAEEKMEAAQAAAEAAKDDPAKQKAMTAARKELDQSAKKRDAAEAAFDELADKLLEADSRLHEAYASLQTVELVLEGYEQRMVIRAEMEFDGKAAVDAPIKLDVSN